MLTSSRKKDLQLAAAEMLDLADEQLALVAGGTPECASCHKPPKPKPKPKPIFV